MAFLYQFDPNGVAYYVKCYADSLSTLKAKLDYKDRIFQLLFKRCPSYYFRDVTKKWIPIAKENIGNVQSYLSQSEFLFGLHPVYDITTLIDLAPVIFDIFGLAFPKISNVILLFQYAAMVPSGNFEIIGIPDVDLPDKDPIKITCDWINRILIFKDIVEAMANIAKQPDFYVNILKYAGDNKKYDPYFKLTKNKTDSYYKISDVGKWLEERKKNS